MDVVLPVIGLFIANAALFMPILFWIRSESRADSRHLDLKLDALIKAIQDETKEFHGRLCNLEGRK